MSLVIDANRAGDFSPPLRGHAAEILKRIRRRTIVVSSGGKLHRELLATKLRSLLAEMERTGCLNRIDDAAANSETEAIVNLEIASDDPHVLAILRLAGAYALYTEDSALIKDCSSGILAREPVILTLGTPAHRVKGHLALCKR